MTSLSVANSDEAGPADAASSGRLGIREFDLSLAEEAVRLLLAGQSGQWPLTTLADIARPPRWVSSAEEAFAFLGRMDYLAAFAHVRRKRGKANLCPVGNNVWVDIDPPSKMDPAEQQRFVSEKLEVVERLVARPSLVLDSGRGAWAWFKLSESQTLVEVERLNKLLALISGSEDTSCSNADRYSRLAGSRNEKTGRVARVLSLDAQQFDPPALAALVEEAAREIGISLVRRSRAKKARGIASVLIDVDLGEVVLPPTPELRADLWEYIRLRPDADQSVPTFGRTRSEIEQSIFCSLVRQGWPDGEIEAFAFQRGLGRYMEEYGVTDYGQRSVRNARLFVEQNPWQGELGIPDGVSAAAETEHDNVSFYKGLSSIKRTSGRRKDAINSSDAYKDQAHRYLRWLTWMPMSRKLLPMTECGASSIHFPTTGASGDPGSDLGLASVLTRAQAV